MEYTRPFAEVAERLTSFVYMAQQVRDDGGVLADNVRQCFSNPDIEMAEALGQIQPGKRFRFETFTVPERARPYAEQVLRARVREKRVHLRKLVETTPRRLLHWMVDEIISEPDSYRARTTKVLDGSGPTTSNISLSCWAEASSNAVRHYCLLEDPGLIWRSKQLLDELVSIGLAVAVDSYVGTLGGEQRWAEYCVAPPANEYLRAASSAPPRSFRLPDHLERCHELFHFFSDQLSNQGHLPMVLTTHHHMDHYYSVVEEDIESSLSHWTRHGLLEKTPEGYYQVRQYAAFRLAVTDQFLRPILHYLFADPEYGEAALPSWF